ncbi:MAG: Lrp/AsnC family transcriptional regulator [Candidatus Helarchaeales archaeon]
MTNSIDDLDLKILDLLKQDSRMPFSEIAEKLNKAEPTIRKRVRRLTQEGIIERFTIKTSDKLKEEKIQSFIRLKVTEASLSTIIEQLQKFEEVKEIYHISGAYRLLIKFEVENLEQVNDFIEDSIRSIQGIKTVENTLVIKRTK